MVKQRPRPDGPGAWTKPRPQGQWIYGVQPVLEALRGPARRVEKVWVAFGRSGAGIRGILDQARRDKVPVSFVDRPSLTRKVGTANHQGVVALLSTVQPPDLDTFLRALPDRGLRFLAFLDEVQDPRNLGAIMRTACAAGVEGIVVPRHRSSPLTPAVMKASAGAAGWIPLVRAGNAVQALERIRERGIFLLGADPGGGTEIYDVDLCRHLCVVIGGEARGLRPAVKKQCEALASIPMIGTIGSLNVSVAAGILFYEVVRQRRERGAGQAGE